MRYVKRFNEGIEGLILSKDISIIDDMLLEFVDSGELENVFIRHDNFASGARIQLVFSDDVVGMDKLILLDKIIKRIKRKYPIVYIYNNRYLCVYNKKFTIKMLEMYLVDDSLESTVNKILDVNFNDVIKGRETIKSVAYFHKNNDDDATIIYINDDKKAYIAPKILNSLIEDFLLSYEDVSAIIKKRLEKQFNIEPNIVLYNN